jgi:hypothetical protein
MGVGVKLSSLGTSATIWLIVPTPDDECGAVGGMRISEVVGGDLPQYPFVHHKSHMICPGLESGPSRWEVVD